MKKLDWTRFKKRIPIKSSTETIFDSWATQENLERWFLSQAQFFESGLKKDPSSKIATGDTYQWMWHGSETIAEGEVLENNNSDFLRFTFLGCEVSVEVKTEDGESIVEITQYNIPEDEASTMSHFVGCSRGWTFYLTNLKSILEGGIDLRNKNSNLVGVINT